MRTLYLVGLFIVALVAARPIQARWESAGDNQSATALAAMSTQQLFNEAFDVCVRRALLGSIPGTTDETRQALAECNDYLTTLFPVVRERNGGNVPQWMTEIVAARTTGECQEAFRTYLNKAAPGTGKRAAATRSPRPMETPNPTPALPPTAMPETTPAPPTAMPSATRVPARPTAIPEAAPTQPRPTAMPPPPTAMPKATVAPPPPTAMPPATVAKAMPPQPRPTALPKGTPQRSGWTEQLPPWLAPR